MKNQNQKISVASEAIAKLSDTGETKKNKLLSLIPEGQSPKVYLNLVKTQVLGTTKDGEARPDEDLLLFLYTCKRTGLDPLVKQIYAIYRWDSRLGREKMTIQAGIDGFRLVAQRAGDYAGQDEAIYLPVDESTKYPVKASVTVYKMLQGARVPFTAAARWNEYVKLNKSGQPENMWSSMPYLMLAKCAEALALRKAFPNELSGIYTNEEMAQAANVVSDLPTPPRFASGEPKVTFGAPNDDNRPAIQGNGGAKDDGSAKEEAKQTAGLEDIGTAEAKGVTEQNKPDLAAVREKLKDDSVSIL